MSALSARGLEAATSIQAIECCRPHAGRVIRLEHRECAFEGKLIDRFRPDEVWWMPNERFLVCDPGVRLLGLAG